MADAEKEDRIAAYFVRACDDRVDINLTFLLDKCQFSSLRGPCVMVKKGYFVVQTPIKKVQNEKLIWGADVEGFFTVRLDDTETIHFKSKLVRIYNAPPDSLYLTMPLPKSIDHGQRRHSKRVSIDRHSASGFGIWYGSMEGGNAEHIPQQIWRPFENEDCQLAEFSASGMRLDLKDDNPLLGKLALDAPILLKGDFGARGKPQPLFVLGSVVRKMPLREREGWMSIGCRFRSWRKVAGPESERWFKSDAQEGIPLINQWLIRYALMPSRAHLEEAKKLE